MTFQYVAVVTALASAMLAQEQKTQTKPADPGAQPRSQADRSSSSLTSYARTWNGTIVNATCSQASNLPSAGAGGGGTASSANTAGNTAGNTTSKAKDEKSVYDMEREVIKRCPADAAGPFAVLTDDGSFYKLDDAGNTQVKSQNTNEKAKKIKNMRVTVTGTVQGDSLKVQSLQKSDKPFGG